MHLHPSGHCDCYRIEGTRILSDTLQRGHDRNSPHARERAALRRDSNPPHSLVKSLSPLFSVPPYRFTTIMELDEEYHVERIMDRRIRRGVVEYYIKWLNYGNEDSTWEPRENLNCDDLIEEYEEQLSRANNGTTNDLEIVSSHVVPRRTSVHAKSEDPWDTNPNLEAEEITESLFQGGILCFRVKWAGLGDSDLVAASVCNERIPFIVLKYYENFKIPVL